MEEEFDHDKIFESIMEENKMEDWIETRHANSITIADLYEGLSTMSSVQVDIHEYLKKVILTIFKNNQAGFAIDEIPQLSSKQVIYLKNIFENATLFLTEQS